MIDRLQRCVCISFQAKAKTKLPQQVNSQRKTKREQMSRPWSAASFSTQITNKRRACRTSWTSIVIIRARFKRNRTMYSGFSFRYAPLCTSLQPYIYIYTQTVSRFKHVQVSNPFECPNPPHCNIGCNLCGVRRVA